MADFESKIKELLNSPDGINQILSIAQAFAGGTSETKAEANTPPAAAEASAPTSPAAPEPNEPTEPVTAAEPSMNPPPATASAPDSMPDLSVFSNMLSSFGSSKGADNILSALSNVDPKMIQTAMGIMNEYQNTDDRRLHVLDALRPYFSEKDAAHIDKAIQITKLSKVVKRAFNSNLGGGDMHV